MLILSQTSKKYLKENLKDLVGSKSLHKLFNEMAHILKEDSQNVDFSGFVNRCNWILGKLVQDKETIMKYYENDTFKDIFKNVQLDSTEDGKFRLLVDDNEVLGNTKILGIVIIVYGYVFLMNLRSMGEKTQDIGGLVLESYSETLTGELVKNCFLSKFSLNGDVIKSICKNLHEANYLSNIISSLLGLLLMVRDFDKVTQSTCLLLVSAIKTMSKNMSGFMYSYIEKAGEILDMDLKFLAQDIYKQLKIASS